MPAPVVPQCELCGARAPTPLKTTCTTCKCVVYCSAAHLADDATRHGKLCRKVVAARKNVAIYVDSKLNLRAQPRSVLRTHVAERTRRMVPLRNAFMSLLDRFCVKQHCATRTPTPLKITCTTCKAVVYCSTADLAADATRHGKPCRQVVEARTNYVQEDQKLRGMEVDCFEPGEVFEECVGAFWLVFNSRPDMHAKFMLIDALMGVGSAVAIEEVLKEASECLTLDEQDHHGVREIVQALMLLLGKVQEAYVFIYYWAGNHDNDESENDDNDDDEDEEDGDKENAEMDEDKPPRIVPCLRPTKINPIDPVDFFLRPYVDSSFHRATLTYVKRTTAPTDVADLEVLHETVLHQVKQTYNLAQTNNARLWPALVDPTALLRSPPRFYSPGTANEVRQHLEVYVKLWHATPYAIEYYLAKQCHG